MKNIFRSIVAVLIITQFSCTAIKNGSGKKDDGKIEVVFMQINDVYEIAPLSGGKEGGMARVATLKKSLLKKNPNTYMVMAGDFVSPSVYNSLQYEGKRIRGKQMIESMNAAGMDLVVFGNHEFDINEAELQDRINESDFQWIASNTFHKKNNGITAFKKTNDAAAKPFPKTFIKTITDADGTVAKIGFIGITLPFNKAEYVSYTDPLVTAKELYNQIKDSVDAVVAITHQLMEEDEKLARELPGLALIIGGHEHDMRFKKEGKVYITKAHANAKSAYVNTLKINKKKSKVKVDTDLEYINDRIPLDNETNAVVEKWMNIAEKNYSTIGFDARKVVMSKGEPLDGRESEIRSHPTNLSKLIVSAIAEAAPQADVAIVNSGSIRVDDIFQMPLTQYDIIRAMPFGGGIQEADMKGSLLIKTLDQGRKNKGIGGYLLYNENINFDEATNTWKINNAAIDTDKTYRVALSDFLFTGKEANMDFLNPKNPDVVKVYPTETGTTNPKSDIRLAIVRYLEKRAK